MRPCSPRSRVAPLTPRRDALSIAVRATTHFDTSWVAAQSGTSQNGAAAAAAQLEQQEAGENLTREQPGDAGYFAAVQAAMDNLASPKADTGPGAAAAPELSQSAAEEVAEAALTAGAAGAEGAEQAAKASKVMGNATCFLWMIREVVCAAAQE